MFSSLLKQAAFTSASFCFTTLKKKQLEKVFTNQKPGESSLFKLLKTGKT